MKKIAEVENRFLYVEVILASTKKIHIFGDFPLTISFFRRTKGREKATKMLQLHTVVCTTVERCATTKQLASRASRLLDYNYEQRASKERKASSIFQSTSIL